MKSTVMDVEQQLQRLLPYRLGSLAMLELFVKLRLTWGEAKSVQVFVEKRLQFTGTTNFLTNPVFDAGVLHVRSLLEFLGLKAKGGKLESLQSRRPDDAGIEFIPSGSGFLRMVTPAQARAVNACGERALVQVCEAAGKGVAHSTLLYPSSPTDIECIGLAANICQRLFEQHVYSPLGRPYPRPLIQ
jgi:hypothetical protein